MAIALNDGSCSAAPVIRQQRDRLRKNQATGAMEPIPNGTDRHGRPKVKQEMVIHAVAMAGTTMQARLGDEGGVPAPGDRVRLILKAKGFGEWIEARRQHRRGRLTVGDVLMLETGWAQQYDQDGNPKGPKIEVQSSADAVPRNVTIGFYSPLSTREGADPAWIEAAEQAYRADEAAARQQQAIPLADGDDCDDERSHSPFSLPAGNGLRSGRDSPACLALLPGGKGGLVGAPPVADGSVTHSGCRGPSTFVHGSYMRSKGAWNHSPSRPFLHFPYIDPLGPKKSSRKPREPLR